MRVRTLSNEAVREIALREISQRDFSDRLVVAHHEAGHAVAAWCHGVKFKRATIKPNRPDQTLGHVLGCRPKWFNPEIDSSPRVCGLAQGRIIELFAGQIAEAKFRGRKPRWGLQSDNQQAVDLAMYLCGSQETMQAYLNFCFLASRDLVNGFWSQIQAVAWGLMELWTIDDEEMIEIVSPGSGAVRESMKAGAAHKRAAVTVKKGSDGNLA